MSDEFVRTGTLMDTTSYPVWAQEMIHDCFASKQAVVQHEFYRKMRDAELTERQTRDFLVGVFPVIEQFPQYMAMNLLKLQYGKSKGHDMARKYLIRNIRIEQNHADYWVDWAEISGVSQQELIYGAVPTPSHALSHWCWHTCDRDTLAAAMAATNYAIEGATGEWSSVICANDTYENLFAPNVRKKAMKWLKLHAEYDDKHPWEALEIICTIMGNNPTARGIHLLGSCIRKSYDYMALILDHALESRDMKETRYSPSYLMEHWERRRAA